MRRAIIFRGKGHFPRPRNRSMTSREDSDFCMQWARRTFQQGLKREDGEFPAAQSLLLMDNLHGQTTEDFKTYLHKFCNMLQWHLPAGCTDEVQPIDAGYGRLLEVNTGQVLDEWLRHGENLQKWECNALTASERRVLIAKWVGEATERIDKLPYRQASGRTSSREESGVLPLYRHRLFERTGTAMTADGAGDDKISLGGLEEGFRNTFMDVEDQNGDGEDCGPGEEQNSGHGDEGNPSSDVEGREGVAEDQDGNRSSDEESEGESSDRPEDPLATLDDDDELAPGEELRGMEIPNGFRLQVPPPPEIDDSLVGRGVLLRMGLEWFGRKITRRAQERTRGNYDYRVMLNEDQSTHSMRLPIEEYHVDENAGVRAWVLLEPIVMPATQDQQVGVRRSGRILTPNVRNIDRS